MLSSSLIIWITFREFYNADSNECVLIAQRTIISVGTKLFIYKSTLTVLKYNQTIFFYIIEYLIPKIKSNYILLLFLFNFQFVNENALDRKKIQAIYFTLAELVTILILSMLKNHLIPFNSLFAIILS